jgi:hypothetical protein|tara:strand:- start:28 stop:624 length:597 start_codon:yes stop_codon:yes gene_type:complete
MIYKFIDNNDQEITVNYLSSLQALVDSGTIKKNTKVKAGLRGKWAKAENTVGLIFEGKKVEETPKEETEDIVDFVTREPTPPSKVTKKFKKEKIVETEKSNEEVDRKLKDFAQEELEKIPETQSVEKEIEDTLSKKPAKEEYKPQEIIGGILIAFGVADFGLSWFGINLTYFLPPDISRFSPVAFMVVGGFIMNAKDE